VNDTVVITLCTCLCTLLGTFGGIITSARLTNYRIQQLEEKVKVHNELAMRMIAVEKDITIVKRDIDELKEDSK
jgi:hypothetical protein